jgi:hypothetical protein
MKKLSFLAVAAWMLSVQLLNAQGTVYSIFAGPSLSTQTVNGFEKDPFLRLHFLARIESSSEISPNSVYASLGYHIKGSAVNTPAYIGDNGEQYAQHSSSIEFHNLSLSVGVKQRREVGSNFFSYGLGLRGDFNLKTDYSDFFLGLQGSENKFTYGLNFDAGWEFPLSELVSTVIEVGFYPDLKEQIYIPFQDTGYEYSNGSPVTIPESYITNVVFEARVGFRFWNKIVYID